MNSPFKFLDPYEKADKDIFFGRSDEADQLYQLVFQANIVLLYGTSGTGKTSLIGCGLANRFRDSDWLPLFVRRRTNINASLREEIDRHARTPIPDDATVSEAVRSLYLDRLRPVYLIFDQFEELFVLGDAEEQRRFIATIVELLGSGVSCKIIISMREEYLAQLDAFEKAVPTLFDCRLRVEPMNRANMVSVIVGTAGKVGIALEEGAATADQIIDNLQDRRSGVQLSYLQVYLDKLYRHAAAAEPGAAIVFTRELVAAAGRLDDVLADFLADQTQAIQAAVSARHPGVEPAAVQHILEEYTTLEGTKQPTSRGEVAKRLPTLAPILDEVIGALRAARILREADDLDELAHDALAACIAANRDAHRTTLLRLRKIVDDRLAVFGQTKTYLSPQELALLRPYAAELGFSYKHTRFIERSRGVAGWQRIRTAVFTAAVLILVLPAAAFALSPDVRIAVRHWPTVSAIAQVPKDQWIDQPDEYGEALFSKLQDQISIDALYELSDHGNAKAQYLLALYYLTIEDDKELFKKYARMAAGNKLAVAENVVGNLLEQSVYEARPIDEHDPLVGKSAAEDVAVRYYERAAAHGSYFGAKNWAIALMDRAPHRSLVILQTALNKHPENPDLLEARALAYLAMRPPNNELAKRDLAVLRRIGQSSRGPNPTRYLSQLCWLEASQNFQTEMALTDCDEAVNASLAQLPTAGGGGKGPREATHRQVRRWSRAHSTRLAGHGLALLQLGQYRLADEQFSSAKSEDPGNTVAMFLSTLARQKLGEMTASEAAEVADAARLDPEAQGILKRIRYSEELGKLLAARPPIYHRGD